MLCVSSDPHIVVELLGWGTVAKGCTRLSVHGETMSAACLFSIFKVPSLLLRDDTLGEVRKNPGVAINPADLHVRNPHHTLCQSKFYFIPEAFVLFTKIVAFLLKKQQQQHAIKEEIFWEVLDPFPLITILIAMDSPSNHPT